MGALRQGMGGKAPRKVKATSPEQIECFEKMTSAAMTNDIDELKTSIQQLEELVPSQAREGKRLHELNEALRLTIREGHLDAAETLLGVQGLHPNDFFTEILAAEKPVDFLDLFSRNGLRIDEVWSRGGIRPLWYDTIPDNLDALKWLLSHGADVNYQDLHCETPLDRAAECGSIVAVKFLLDHGAKVDQSNVLQYAAGSTWFEKDDSSITVLMEYLLREVGIEVNTVSTTDEKETALHRAVHVASLTRVRFLLDHGANVSVEDDTGSTPLQHASANAKDGESKHTNDVARFLEEWVEK